MVLSVRLGPEMECAEPTLLNSNLLPVKANGDVRFLSEVSQVKEKIKDPNYINSAVISSVADRFLDSIGL